MKTRRVARLLGLPCLVGTLLATAACTSPPTDEADAVKATGPNTATLTLPSPSDPGSLSVNASIPLPASAVGEAEGDEARLAHLIADGISVSLVPVVEGAVTSPLNAALASMKFAPNPGTSGTWEVDADASSLLATRAVGADRTSGTFTYSSEEGCDGTGSPGDCGGQLSIEVTTEVSDVAAGRLAEQFELNAGAMAIAIGNSDGRSLYIATTPVGEGVNRSDGSLTVGLDPTVSLSAALRPRGSTVLDEVVDAAFGPVAAEVRPAALGGQPTPVRNAVVAGTTTPSVDFVQDSPDTSGSGCGSVMGTTSAGLGIAAGFMSMVPVVGPGLAGVTQAASVSTELMGTNAGDACIEAEFALINGQLADQEGQIQTLQDQYALQQNEIYQLMVDGANAQTNLDLTNYNNALQTISPSQGGGPGIFGNFMVNLGFWNDNYTAVPGATIAGSASDQTFLTTVAASTSEAAAFADNLNSLSGSAVDVTACSATACPESAISPNLSSSLVMLWSSEAQQLQATAELYRSQVTNVVPLFDQYNSTIVEQFQNSLGVLQQAFSLEAMVNQLNYDHATTECTWGQSKECANIDSFGGIPGTWYGYCRTLTNGVCPSTSTAAETTAYNQAQYQLAQVYAWRVGLLYDTALSFLFTDTPIGPQAYPATTATGTVGGRSVTSGAIPYGTLLGSALTGVAGIDSAVPMESLPDVVTSGGSTWQANGALYQFSGIFDANGCATEIMAANEVGGASAPPPSDPCPPAIFLTSEGGTVNQSQYTGNVLQPYTSQGDTVTLTGLLQANLLMCNPDSPGLGWYTPPEQNTGNAAGLELGQWYLNCGNWATITDASDCFPGATCPLGWLDPVSGDPWLVSQYYSWSSPFSDTFQMNFEIGGNAINFSGADGCGTSDPINYSSGTPGQNYEVSSRPCYLSLSVINPDSMEGVTGMQTNNQAGTGNGLQIPVMWNQAYSSKDYSYWSFEPQQVPPSEIGTYGFTCEFETCTMVDGSQWTANWSPASSDPSCSDCSAVEILNLQLTQVT